MSTGAVCASMGAVCAHGHEGAFRRVPGWRSLLAKPSQVYYMYSKQYQQVCWNCRMRVSCISQWRLRFRCATVNAYVRCSCLMVVGVRSPRWVPIVDSYAFRSSQVCTIISMCAARFVAPGASLVSI